MESTPAEVLPELYRAILDAVARLEVAGQRARAARVRRAATAAYSKAWDDRARRRLEALLREAQQHDVQDHPGRVRRGLPRGLGRRAGASGGLGRSVPPVAHQDG
jgi:hypothetical protein